MSNRARAVTELLHYGLQSQSAGRLGEAEAAYRKVLGIAPRNPDALHLLGMVAAQQGRLDAALDLIGRAITEKPNVAMYHYNRGNVLNELGRLDEAVESYRVAERRKPDFPDLHTGLGLALRAANRLDEAEISLREALRRDPADASLYCNLASLLSDAGRLDEAQALLQAAMRLAPDRPEYQSNLGMMQLLAGQLQAGFTTYQARWHVPPMVPRGFRQPVWRGEKLAGRTLLLHAEQGLGDTLQFCRYLAMFDPADRVILEAQRPLLRLLGTLPGAPVLVAAGDPLPPFDLHCPLLTLPVAFGTEVATIPATVPYLHADPAAAAIWRARLAGYSGLRVGLVWAGKPDMQEVDRKRSLRFEQVQPILDLPGVTFVSLQKGPAAVAQLAGSSYAGQVLDWTEALTDFADTAALIDALDLVIGVDTSVVHLAGAMGKPVWLLNRFNTCWRWLLDRDDSPWYPTLRQFRQTTPGDWDAVFAAVRAALLADSALVIVHPGAVAGGRVGALGGDVGLTQERQLL